MPGQTADLGKPLDVHEVDSFLAFHADGSVTIYTSHVDVGTGLRAAMPQMAAEELGIPFERITLVEGDTAITPNHGGTGGSTGIPQGAVAVRQAAATARQAFLNLGAEQLKRPASRTNACRRTSAPGIGWRGHRHRHTHRWAAPGAEGRPEGSAEGPYSLFPRRQTAAAARRPGEVYRSKCLCTGFRHRRHAARPSDPAAGHWGEAFVRG